MKMTEQQATIRNLPGWALKYPDGSWVGLDRDSGGYPFPARFVSQINIWTDRDQAVKYQQMDLSESFTLYKITGIECEIDDDERTT